MENLQRTIQFSEIKTIEDYRAYTKEQNKLWYAKNKEKKKAYQKKRYYEMKAKKETN